MLHHNLCIAGPNQPGPRLRKRVWKKGAEENFARKLRLLGPGGHISLFLTPLWHYDCLAGTAEASRSAHAVQPQRVSGDSDSHQGPDRAPMHTLSLGVTFSLRESKLLRQKAKQTLLHLVWNRDAAWCQLGRLLLLSLNEFQYRSARSQSVLLRETRHLPHRWHLKSSPLRMRLTSACGRRRVYLLPGFCSALNTHTQEPRR